MNKLYRIAAIGWIAVALAVAGCHSVQSDTMRVGSYNIRCSHGDIGTVNAWSERRADLVAEIKKLDLDAFGMQEVCPDQEEYLLAQLPEYEFVGEHRDADRKSGESSPVCYRKSRFEALQRGTFWLSETPEIPGVKGWKAACPRVCSYLVLRERSSGKTFCFANTHTDHVSEKARIEGMKLIIERMKRFGAGSPIVFTGDHNCRHGDAPAIMARKMLKDARDISERTDCGPANTFQGFGKYKDGPLDASGKGSRDLRIDYIYVSDGVRVLDFTTHGDKRPGKDLYPSDHYPVTATVKLP